MKFPIHEIWIDEDATDAALTAEIVGKLPEAAVFRDEAARERRKLLELEPDALSRGKRILRLMTHKGAFIKPCPGTPEYVCCGLEILHIGQGCPMDCRYCALQTYFNRPVLEVFVNREDLFERLENHLTANPGFHRICTGEFTDSLALDSLTGLAASLVDFFSTRSNVNATLEIKTKTDSVDSLPDLNPNGKVILAFSVNAESISRSEELRAAPLERRIRAAVRAAERGYRLAFHFDPIIPFPGWEDAYGATVSGIFANVDASAIAWISLGVLRFAPELKTTVASRFGRIPYFHDGFLRGLDGKSRLHADRRIDIYRRLSRKIWAKCPNARIYLCMESSHIWEQVTGMSMSDKSLADFLDAAVI
ncbi:MAG TPA: hypothetical protein VK463_10750 [Desulfomonilaceae bacterium]|nr:hypothetical protein [Desulfomonilaceae bacterium]